MSNPLINGYFKINYKISNGKEVKEYISNKNIRSDAKDKKWHMMK